MGIRFFLYTKNEKSGILYFPKRPINRLPTHSSILLLLLLLLLFRTRRKSAVRLLLLSHAPSHRGVRPLSWVCWRGSCEGAMVCGLGGCVAGL
jgi:hypothetical protein